MHVRSAAKNQEYRVLFTGFQSDGSGKFTLTGDVAVVVALLLSKRDFIGINSLDSCV
jgi:hypothetical protein|tara:strand:- start:4809 stop:4979 length:171 start_codon:yes stop_codon:yes gene_type:complete